MIDPSPSAPRSPLSSPRSAAIVSVVSVLAAATVLVEARAAEPEEVRADPICAPHLSPTQVLELRQGSSIRTFCDVCDDILTCPAGVAALAGKPEPEAAGFIAAALHYKRYDDGEMSRCVGRHCDANTYLGAVIWGLPDAGARLQALVDTPEKLRELSCGGKADIFRALWFLGDPAAADVMIAGFKDTACTDDHVDEVLPAIAAWPLTPEQSGAIASWCTEQVFTDSVDRADAIKKACSRFVGMTGAGTEDTLEFARAMAGGGGRDQYEAIRAIGAMTENKGLSKTAARELAGILAAVRQERGSGKDKRVTFLAREYTVAAAIGLLGVADKLAKEAVGTWLAVDAGRGKPADRSGFEQFAAAAPFATGKAAKAARKLLEPAYKALAGVAASNPMYAIDQTRAAVYLAQMGSNKGLERILEAVSSADTEQIDAVLDGIGGHESYWGSFRIGAGGIRIGGKAGLSVKDAQKVVDALQRRRKFMKKGQQDNVSRAILDIRGRIAAAG